MAIFPAATSKEFKLDWAGSTKDGAGPKASLNQCLEGPTLAWLIYRRDKFQVVDDVLDNCALQVEFH